MPINKNLITGGAGFIGSHLAKKLIDNGEEVICIDNFLTSNNKNIKNLLSNPLFKIIKHDVTKPLNIEADKIWHLACPASPIDYQNDPIETSRTIFIGTYNMLQLAKKFRAKFFLASTSEVYGDPQEHPQKESYRGSVNTTGIRSCYVEGKRLAETLCADFKRIHSLDIRIARIFNTYGPHMRSDDGRVISNFIIQALKKKSLTIYGEGHQTRSFCFVDDLIDAMILLINSNYHEPINIGNPQEIGIKEIALLINKLTNNYNDFLYMPLPEDDPKKRKPSIELAKRILNWIPNTELSDGLKKTIDWFKFNYIS